MRKFAFTILILCLSSCSISYNIEHSFESIPKHESPDYNKNNNWSALPFIDDYADIVPDTLLKNRQDESKIDVFFLHPTTFLDEHTPEWNASITDSTINYYTDYWAVRHQATAFNNVGRIYAPRYRQAHIKSYYHLDKGGKEAILFAYEDVKKAFEYYIEHYNNGRSFIIASHSQGTTHATFLLRDYVDNTDLREQLVAAYLVGMSVGEDTYQTIKPCRNAAETGCFTSWQTYSDGYTPHDNFDEFRKKAFVVNPITWTTEEDYSNFEDHKGILMSNFKTVYKKSVKAKLNKKNNIVWIKQPKVPFAFLKKMTNYHVADYNLYWFNIRENAANRVEKYLKQKKGAI
jgi:hypothetical protein